MIKILLAASLILGVAYGNDSNCIGRPEGFVFDNPSSCAGFFMCRSGVALPENCPNDLHFNPDRILCDLAENVDCASAPTEAPTTAPPTSAPTTPGTGVSPTPNICPESGVHLFGHPHLCNRFISCLGGTLTEQTCGVNQQWNVALNRCDPPALADCRTEMNQCPSIDDPNYIVRVACTLNCNRYYICANQELKESFCGPNLHFNPIYKWCELPETAGCTLTPPAGPNPEYQCPSEGITMIPDEDSCEFFVTCRHGVGIRQRCAPGFYFDRDQMFCNVASLVDCPHNNKRSFLDRMLH